METFLTLNSNGNIGFEPHQCNLKLQRSEDKIDVVATSEFDDYLTVSENKYSECAILANISDIKTNQAFVSDTEASQAFISDTEVHRAFVSGIETNQNIISNILEKTNIETDSENIGTDQENSNSGSAQIVDLNKFVTSPCHISHGRDTKVDLSSFQNFQEPLNKASPVDKTDIDTFSGYPNPSQISESDIDTDSALSSSSSFSKDSSNQAKTELQITDTYQVIPHSSILDTNSDPVSCVSSTYLEQISARTSYSNESDTCEINLPNSYRQENFEGFDQSVHATEDVRYNDVLEDINLIELSDSEIPGDTYAASLQSNYPKTSLENYHNLQKSGIDLFEDKKCCVYNGAIESNEEKNNETLEFLQSNYTKTSLENYHNLQKNGIDIFEDKKCFVYNGAIESNEEKNNETVSVSPPVDFLDYQTNLEITENQKAVFIESHAANTDTNVESFTAQKDFTDINGTKLSNNGHEFNLESIFQDFEQDSASKNKYITNLNVENQLVFNSELAAPFHIFIQEHGIIDQSEQIDPIYYYEINEIDNLHVITGSGDDTCVTNQFEPETTKSSSVSPVYNETQFQLPGHFNESIMDDKNDSMLEKTLNMEFENLPECKMYETRLKLGEHVITDEPDIDRKSTESDNVVAENIAKEINQNEKRNYGYIVKYDDEPDMFPEEDAPEQALEHARKQVLGQSNAPQFIFSNNADMLLDYNRNDLVTNDLNEDETERILEKDQNLINDAIHIDLNVGHEHTMGENEVHVFPVKIENDINLKAELEQEKVNDTIVPVNIERKLEFPSHFDVVEVQFDVKNDSESKAINVTKKKLPPPVLPKPRKSLIKIDKSERETDENFSNPEHILEDIITPVKVKKSNINTLGNVINAVNAFKVGSTDFKVVEIEKGARVNAIEDHYNSAINFCEIKMTETFPPKNEQEVVFREKISLSKKLDREVLPPRKDILEIETNVIDKPKELVPTKHQSVLENLHHLKTSLFGCVPITKTTDAGGPKENIVKHDSAKQTAKETPSVSHSVVPPLNLETSACTDIDNTYSSQDDCSKERLSSTYRMTTVEAKQDSFEPTCQIKTQITPLSFNPKSLSQSGARPALSQSNTRPLHFSAIASYSGTKGLSKPGSRTLKADHPIKRMESMPFEVSILKGILGIGIKTSMTPEGYVQVTEILPNGPVGREGNIVVGDYILSINGTELTGQTDGKVQQILRLLPRGLSKIVASAVPLNPSIEKVHVAVETEKIHLTPRQSISYSTRHIQKRSSLSSQWPPATSATTDNVSETTVPLQFNNRPSSLEYIQYSKNISKLPLHSLQSPVPSPRSSLSSPRSCKTLSDSPLSSPGSPKKLFDSPVPSPRSPKTLLDSTMPSPRSCFGSENSHSSKVEQNFNLHTITSKSLQQTGSLQNIMKMPPPVAPKPKRVHEKLVESKIDGKETLIETDFIVPNKASNVECELKGKAHSDILPGLVSYDTMSSTNANLTSCMELLADIITVDVKDKKGVVNTHEELSDIYVANTDMPSDMELLTDIITSDVKEKKDVVNTHEELSNVLTSETVDSGNTVVSDVSEYDDKIAAIGHDTFCLKAIDSCKKLDAFQLQADDSFSENIPDIRSTSRTSDSECSEEEIIPENVKVEKLQGKQKYTDNLESNMDVNNIDFVKSNSEINQNKSDVYEQFLSSPNMNCLNAMAINIVADVIKSVQKMDLSSHEPDPNETTPPLTEDIPFLQTEDPLVSINGSPNLDIVSNHYKTLPLLPYCDVPTFSPIPGSVNDLALYPDNGEESREQVSKIEHDQKEVTDVITASVDVSLQATTPFTDTNFSKDDIDKCKPPLTQAKKELSIQDDVDAVDNTEAGDEIINNVISLYSNIEKESNEDIKNILAHAEEYTNCDAKTISSSEDIINCHDIGENVVFVGDVGNDNLPATTNYPHPQLMTQTVNVHSNLENANQDCSSDNQHESLLSKTELKSISRANNTDEPQGEKSSKETHRLIQPHSQSGVPEITGGKTLITVTMNKGVTGLGFVIQGGKFSPKGDQPISIKRIFKGGPAEGHLQEMDEIMEVNGEDMSNMRQNEAWHHLKFLPSGNVVMKVRRHLSQEAD